VTRAAKLVLLVAFGLTFPMIIGAPHGNRVFWTVAIAALPALWVTAGYHAWRRICPLGTLAQLGRGRRRAGTWLARNRMLVQLAVMIACLSLRLAGANGSPVWLAALLAVLALAAIATSFLYAGKTWCNFLCPIGFVEQVHTEPAGGVLDTGMTSQCTPCVACKKHCPDIDQAAGYWKELRDPKRRLAYFAWPGVVVGFYMAFPLYGGDWDYYFSGRWAYDGAHPSALTAPLLLIACGAASFALLALIERIAARLAGREVRHAMLVRRLAPVADLRRRTLIVIQ